MLGRAVDGNKVHAVLVDIPPCRRVRRAASNSAPPAVIGARISSQAGPPPPLGDVSGLRRRAGPGPCVPAARCRTASRNAGSECARSGSWLQRLVAVRAPAVSASRAHRLSPTVSSGPQAPVKDQPPESIGSRDGRCWFRLVMWARMVAVVVSSSSVWSMPRSVRMFRACCQWQCASSSLFSAW